MLVYLAQAAHEHVIDTLTSAKPEDRITRTSDYRLDRPRYSVYIDDRFGVALERHRGELERLQREYEDVMLG